MKIPSPVGTSYDVNILKQQEVYRPQRRPPNIDREVDK